MYGVPFLANTAVRAAILFAAACITAFILRRSSASVRYFVWTCAFGAVLLMPALIALSPRWALRVRTPAIASAPAAHGSITVQDNAAAIPSPPRPPAPVVPWVWILWLSGAALMFVRLAAGHARLRRVLATADSIRDGEWKDIIDDVTRRLEFHGRAGIKKSAQVDVPLTYGPFRPAVILPCDCDGWSAARRRVVLLHEMTHIRRMDPLWQLLVNIVLALHWFNPLAWFAAAQFRCEQERSCDDMVLTAGARPAAYAEHLLDLARSIAEPRARLRTAALGMAEKLDLESRVHALLEPDRKRHGVGRRFSLATVAAAVAIIVPLAAVHAQSASAASLSGSIYDPSGAAIPNATILLRNLNGSNEEITHANDAGQYTFHDVPAGQYDIEVRAPGFAKVRQPAVTLAGGAAVNLNLTLDVGQIDETVQVVGKGPRPVPSGPPHRIRVGGNVQATKLLSNVRPAYPPDAEAEGVEGTVLLRAVISKEGNLTSVTVLNKSIDPRLAKAAADAVAQWRYAPTLLNGVPVEVVTTISVNFRLEH